MSELEPVEEELPEILPQPEQVETKPKKKRKKKKSVFTCKYCGENFDTMYELGVHSRKCEKRKEALRAEREKEEPLSPYKTEADANEILEKILKRHPDITARVRDEVMDWARLKGMLHPTELPYILSSMKGVSPQTANIIAAKYSLALQQAQQGGKIIPYPLATAPTTPQQPWIPSPTTPTSVPPSIPRPTTTPVTTPQTPYFQQPTTPTPQPYQPYQPYYQQPQLRPEDIKRMIREELRILEERLKPKEQETYVDIEEPVRLPDGKVILGPDDRPIVKRMRVPASQASLFTHKEDTETKLLEKLKIYKELFGTKEKLSESRIREIIRQELSPTVSSTKQEKPITPEDVQRAAAEAARTAVKQFISEHERERKVDERFQRLEKAIRETASARAVEGYKEDSYRILGQGLTEVASVIKERKPIEVIVREGGPLLLGTAPPKEIQAGAAPGEGILERLKQRGWVAEE